MKGTPESRNSSKVTHYLLRWKSRACSKMCLNAQIFGPDCPQNLKDFLSKSCCEHTKNLLESSDFELECRMSKMTTCFAKFVAQQGYSDKELIDEVKAISFPYILSYTPNKDLPKSKTCLLSQIKSYKFRKQEINPIFISYTEKLQMIENVYGIGQSIDESNITAELNP